MVQAINDENPIGFNRNKELGTIYGSSVYAKEGTNGT